jgi:hypothetical protein
LGSGSRPDTLARHLQQVAHDMALNPDLIDWFRAELRHEGVTEKKMFGGLCFLTGGNMIGGIHKDGAMLRVGPLAEPAARALPGTGPMLFTGKPMKGFVDVSEESMADPALRHQLVGMALAHARSLPPK